MSDDIHAEKLALAKAEGAVPQDKGGGKGCLKGCLIGCGSTVAVLILVLTSFIVWLTIPYQAVPAKAFLRAEHTAAFRLGHSKNAAMAVLNGADDFMEVMYTHRYRKAPPILRQTAIESKMQRWRQQRDQAEQLIKTMNEGGPQNGPVLLSCASPERENFVLAGSFHGFGKKAQCFFRFLVAFLPSEVLTRIGKATVIHGRVSEADAGANKVPDPLTALLDPNEIGFSVYQGHLIVGALDPSLRLAINAIAGKGLPPQDSFVARHWPSGKGVMAAAAIDNRKGSLRRMLLALLAAARKIPKPKPKPEAEGATPAGPQDPPSGVEAIAMGDEIDRAWDKAFAGAEVKLAFKGPKTLVVHADLHPKKSLRTEEVARLVREAARLIGEAARISLKVEGVEKKGQIFRVIVVVTKAEEAWKRLIEALGKGLERVAKEEEEKRRQTSDSSG